MMQKQPRPMPTHNIFMPVLRVCGAVFLAACLVLAPASARAEMDDYPVVKLQSLDKVTARTMTFEANVGATIKFGTLYIKVQSCRKAPPIETPEAAAFLQVWEVAPKSEKSEWIFSGWMFASSPALSPMDHPIYDVWVLDCLAHKTGEAPVEQPAVSDSAPNSAPDSVADGAATDGLNDADIPVEEPPPSAE